jgi:hypothetical protein
MKINFKSWLWESKWKQFIEKFDKFPTTNVKNIVE